MNQEFKRRVIYTALADKLTSAELWDVLWRWEHNFADKTRYELNQFLAACSDISAIRLNRGDIYRLAIRMLMSPEEFQLRPDPMPMMLKNKPQESASASKNKVDQISEEDVISALVMTDLLQHMIDQVKIESAIQVMKYAQINAQRKNMPISLIKVLEDSNHKIALPKTGVKENDAKQLVSLFYIGLCELEGPVAIDAILSEGIQTLLKKYSQKRDYKLMLQKILDK